MESGHLPFLRMRNSELGILVWNQRGENEKTMGGVVFCVVAASLLFASFLLWLVAATIAVMEWLIWFAWKTHNPNELGLATNLGHFMLWLQMTQTIAF